MNVLYFEKLNIKAMMRNSMVCYCCREKMVGANLYKSKLEALSEL